MKHEGLNDPDDSEASNLPELPKYDENGNLYEYRTREGIWGLVDTDGGFVMGQLSPDDEGPGTTDDLTAGIYKVDHGASGSYLLGNSYDPEESARGKLTVKKILLTIIVSLAIRIPMSRLRCIASMQRTTVR